MSIYRTRLRINNSNALTLRMKEAQYKKADFPSLSVTGRFSGENVVSSAFAESVVIAHYM